MKIEFTEKIKIDSPESLQKYWEKKMELMIWCEHLNDKFDNKLDKMYLKGAYIEF